MSVDEAAAILSSRIFMCAVICAEQVKKSYEKDREEKSEIDAWKFWEIILKFQFLFLHITDRMAFGILGHEKRANFMDILGEITVESTVESAFPSQDPQKKEQVKKSMFDDLNVSNVDYSKYKKMFAEKNESHKDTLFWEFGKRLSETVDNTMDIVYIMLAISLAVGSLKKLKIADVLERIK